MPTGIAASKISYRLHACAHLIYIFVVIVPVWLPVLPSLLLFLEYRTPKAPEVELVLRRKLFEIDPVAVLQKQIRFLWRSPEIPNIELEQWRNNLCQIYKNS